MKVNVGDRVEHEHLGEGEVVKVISSGLHGGSIAYIVMFDERPPVQYNMGENPALVFPSSLIYVIKETQ